MTTSILDSCDIYRDGGSYGAVLRDPSSTAIAIFLEVVPWDLPTEPSNYECVWRNDGEIPDPSGTCFRFHENETVELLDWMRNADVSNASIESKERFSEMYNALSLMIRVSNETGQGINLGTIAFAFANGGVGCAIALSMPLPRSTVICVGDLVAVECHSGFRTSRVIAIDAIRDTKPMRYTLVLESLLDFSEITPNALVFLKRRDEQ